MSELVLLLVILLWWAACSAVAGLLLFSFGVSGWVLWPTAVMGGLVVSRLVRVEAIP